jgi:hypothetical protein
MSRAQLTSTVEQNTGGAVAPYVAGKNAIINGGFDIWQRGTSFASTAGYLADRWTNSSAVNSITVSRQSTTPPSGSQYYMRLTSTANGSYMNLYQYIETANAQTLWGQSATFSIKMRKNSTTTLTSISFGIDKSATADAGSGATWTSLGSSSATIASMSTTTWTTYTVTVSVPNDGTANSLRIFLSMNGSETSGGYVEYSQAQLEVGSVATPFSRAGGTLQGELAACQRYYWQVGPGSAYANFGIGGFHTASNSFMCIINTPVTMRTTPTPTTAGAFQTNGTGISLTSLGLNTSYTPSASFNGQWTCSGATTGYGSSIRNDNSTTAYIALSAEL